MSPAPTAPRSPEATVSRIAYSVAFISGTSALMYQVAWAKMLALTVGSTTVAAAGVIGALMAGMGLGAWLFHVFSSRYNRLFLLYGVIELGIVATTAALTPVLYKLPVMHAWVTGLPASQPLLGLLFALIVFLLLLVPSMLMGATFPALCAGVIRSTQGITRHLGPLYGLNTIGAAAGALLAGFILIESIGNSGSVWLANAGNLVCALAAFALVRYGADREGASRVVAKYDRPQARSGPGAGILVLLLVGSGFATMAYEMLWMRIFKYIVGNSTYAMSLVLTIFLVGLGLGGVLHRRMSRSASDVKGLYRTQLAIAASSLLALACVAWILNDPILSQRFSMLASKVLYLPWYQGLITTALVPIVVLLPPTILMGLAFPLASALYINRVESLGKDLGQAYLIANLGSVAGVFVGALLLLPGFGMMRGVKIVVAVNLALALLVVVSARHTTPIRRLPALLISVACVLFALMLPSRLEFRGELEEPGNSRLLFWREDEIATIKVLQQEGGEARAMSIDGCIIGSSHALHDIILHKQIMLAHLPLALNPDARRVLTVGLGSASTMQTLGNYPQIESLTCVEISPAVVDGARYFDEGAILNDPRGRVIVDDAVHFLLADNRVYDAIISDCKQNYQFSGNASILSREFYRYALSRLSPDGLFVEWIPMNLPPRSFGIVFRTIVDVFPEVNIFYYTPNLLLVVGSGKPLDLTRPSPQASFSSAGAKDNLGFFDIENVLQVLSGRVCGKAGLKAVLGEGEVNSWDRPLLEFVPYKEFLVRFNPRYQYANLKLMQDAAAAEGEAGQPAVSAELAPYVFSSRELLAGFLAVYNSFRPEDLRPYCQRAQALNPNDGRAAIISRRIAAGMDNLLTPGLPAPPDPAVPNQPSNSLLTR